MHGNKFTWTVLAAVANILGAPFLSAKISYMMLVAGLVLLGWLLVGKERDDVTTKFVIAPVLGITSMVGMYRHAPESPWGFGLTVGCMAVFAILGVAGLFMTRSKNRRSRVAGWTIASIFGIVVPTLWFGICAWGGAGVLVAFAPLTFLGIFIFVANVVEQEPDQEWGEEV